MRLLIRWAIIALALFAAAWLVPGIHVDTNEGWVVYAVMAVILSLANALIRPLLKLLTCPLIMSTLGLFTLVINAITLWIAAVFANKVIGVGFYVDGFWPAFWGSLVVSVVSVLLNLFVKDEEKDHKKRR